MIDNIPKILAWASVIAMFAVIGYFMHGLFVPDAMPKESIPPAVTQAHFERTVSARGICEMKNRKLEDAIYDIAGEPRERRR